MATLGELASFVRSKNAGPFMCTIDIFFEDPANWRRVAASQVLTSEAVSKLYRVSPETVRVFSMEAALAMKVSFPRRIQAGDPGDSDVACGQQFSPLLSLEVDTQRC